MLKLFSSPLLAGVDHGFSSRAGGVSRAPYSSLNLNRSTGDDPGNIRTNRSRLLARFGTVSSAQLALLSQVHGDTVVAARGGEPLQEADAQHSADPQLLLAITWADCLPLLFHDPDSGAVAAAHCGWRGSLARLAGKVVSELGTVYGSNPARVRVVIGPGICQDCYQVGPELAARFGEAGYASEQRPDPERPGHARLNLAAVNRRVLLEAGVSEAHISDLALCTSCRPAEFFSHRRDAGRTGRHWALIRATG